MAYKMLNDSYKEFGFEKKNLIRMHVKGDKGVGKSAFIKCVVFGGFDIYSQSSIGTDFLSRKIHIGEEQVLLQLWEAEPPSYNCLIILYEISCRKSFDNACKMLEEIRSENCEVPILLLGNKADRENKRCVMAYEGEIISLQYQTSFSEINCQASTNVRQPVVDFIKSMLSTSCLNV